MVSMIAGIVLPSLLAIAARHSAAQLGAAGSGALVLGTLAALRFFAVGMMRLGVGKSAGSRCRPGAAFWFAKGPRARLEKVRGLTFLARPGWLAGCPKLNKPRANSVQ